MRMNSTLAVRRIKDLVKGSFFLNRDATAVSGARCQVWTETDGKFLLLATGRTWEAAISSLRRMNTGINGNV